MFLTSCAVLGNISSKANDELILCMRFAQAAKVEPEPIYVFIKAPSMEALEKRLRGTYQVG